MGNRKLEIVIDWEGLEKVFKVISLGREQKDYKELLVYYDEVGWTYNQKYLDFENLLSIKGQSDLENFFVNLFSSMTSPAEENIRKIYQSTGIFTPNKLHFHTLLNTQYKEDTNFDFLFDNSHILLPLHRDSEKQRNANNDEAI